MPLQLRDYQTRAVHEILAAWRDGYRAPFLVAPTGSGKTIILAALCQILTAQGRRVMVLVHRQEILDQTKRTLASAGLTESDQVSVLTVQRAANHLTELGPVDYFLIDEAHHCAAGSWRKVLDTYPSARLLGVSATPERLDGKGLGIGCGGYFDRLIQGPTVTELIAQKLLTPPRVFSTDFKADFSHVRVVGGDFDRAEQEKLLKRARIVGDVIKHYRRLCKGVPSVAFCPTVAYAQHLAEIFCQSGYRAACVDGKLSSSVRRDLIEALGRGELNVLTSCDIISEGTDLPVVGAAILLRKTKSLALYLQQVGRALRIYPGKSQTIILDHVGNCFLHGLPDQERTWTLAGRKRSQALNPVVSCCTCLNCYAVFRSGLAVCPVCGAAIPVHARKIEETDGELVEITADALPAPEPTEFKRLVTIGQNRGYRYAYGWARHVLRARNARVR